jgi:hypothetical protein
MDAVSSLGGNSQNQIGLVIAMVYLAIFLPWPTGLELTASLDANCNYFIHLDGGDASSALARAVITGVEITTPSW